MCDLGQFPVPVFGPDRCPSCQGLGHRLVEGCFGQSVDPFTRCPACRGTGRKQSAEGPTGTTVAEILLAACR
jgi:DnaJ-class molecular chaperone